MGTQPIATPTLTPFVDPLRVPAVYIPAAGDGEGCAALRITMRRAHVQLHSALPPTEVWAYDGLVPGPTIEVQHDQLVHVEWVNDLAGHLPVTAVTAPDATTGPIPQNEPGRSGGQRVPGTRHLAAWTTVHLHGGRTAADSDGWTDNVSGRGQTMLARYEHNQRATLLWYHDHAMGVTRFNVFAGLAGMWIIRDPEEAALGLPSGPHELPLLIQDRNLDTHPDGTLTGHLLHKVEAGTMEFFGPYTLVNGTVWPYHAVEARQYRLRVLNGANSRVYRLVLLDDTGQPVPAGIVRQIGTDGGLLGVPVDPPADGLVLAPAERADLIVDFRPYRGRNLRLVNTALAPFDGTALPAGMHPGDPDLDGRLPYPDVLQFRVAAGTADDPFVMPAQLSDFVWQDHDHTSHRQHRSVALLERDGLLTLNELAATTNDDAAALLTVDETDAAGATTTATYRSAASLFDDRTNWHVAAGSTEVWRIINLTGDTHPFHVHLAQFQVLGRQPYIEAPFGTIAFDAATLQPPAPNERGWKDTVRVNPGERVLIAPRFAGYCGRYVYHCHLLEHEDHQMMRPFVVLPEEILALMDGPGMAMGAPGHGGTGHGH